MTCVCGETVTSLGDVARVLAPDCPAHDVATVSDALRSSLLEIDGVTVAEISRIRPGVWRVVVTSSQPCLLSVACALDDHLLGVALEVRLPSGAVEVLL